MRPVAPRIDGVEESSYDGDDFKALTYGVTRSEEGTRTYIMRWTFTPEERARVLAGEDIYLLTVGYLPAHQMAVGPAVL